MNPLAVRTLRLALAAGLWVVGCGPHLPEAYEEARAKWTREARTYEDFETRLHIRAILKTGSFRDAYVEAYGAMFDLDPATRARLLEVEREEARQSHVILAMVHTGEARWNDLSPRHGIWEVRLENSQGAYARPSAVRRLDSDNPTWRRLLPSLTGHEKLYELRFARVNDDGVVLGEPGGELTLVVAGAPARVRMTWALP